MESKQTLNEALLQLLAVKSQLRVTEQGAFFALEAWKTIEEHLKRTRINR